MISNYVKIAWRNLLRNKGYSMITTLGLSVAVACAVLVGLYVHHEFSYESHHEKAERIYRIGQNLNYDGNQLSSRRSPSMLAQTVRDELPAVEAAARLTRRENILVRHEGESAYEDALFYTEQAVLDIFTVPFLRGDPESALSAPGSVVISEEMAGKYFGEDDPIGKILTVTDDERTMTVTGIIRNPPSHTELPFHFLVNPADVTLGWETVSSTTSYLLLEPGTDTGRIEQQMVDITRANSDNTSLQSYTLERLDRLHLYGLESTGDIRYIYIFSLAALFLLLIAVVNHINLSVARLIPRSREVGIRKCLGARQSQLSLRYLAESFLLSLIAMLAALVLVEFAYPAVHAIPGVTLADYHLLDPWLWAVLIPGMLLITLLSASYVAFYLARLKPSAIFRDQATHSPGGTLLRKGLIVFQFAVSIALICCTFIVQGQLNYLMESNLGFDKDHVVTIGLKGDQQERHDLLRQRIEKLPGVEGAAASNGTIGVSGSFEFMLGEEQQLSGFSVFSADPRFLPLMGIESRSGDPLNPEGGEWIVNESFVRAMDMEDPRGEILGELVGMDSGPFQSEISGIAKDFHYRSLHDEIRPLAIQIGFDGFNTLNVRLEAGSVASTMDRIRGAWNEFAGGLPMEYTFLDDSIANIYRSSRRFAQIFWGFSLITVIIACMGLFALAALSAERRTKEIGIRKVLGASVGGIVTLLGKEFIKLVAIGFLIAVPASYIYMNRWLNDFAYRVEPGVGIYALAGSAALLIALATVSWHSVRAARANPVDSLRTE